MAIHAQTVLEKKSSQQVVEVFVSAFILRTDQLCVCEYVFLQAQKQYVFCFLSCVYFVCVLKTEPQPSFW